MGGLVSLGEAASAVGVSIVTLRRWEASDRLVPEHTAGGYRRQDLAKLKPGTLQCGDGLLWVSPAIGIPDGRGGQLVVAERFLAGSKTCWPLGINWKPCRVGICLDLSGLGHRPGS